MSRDYDIEVEIDNVPEDKSDVIATVLGKEAVDSLDDFDFSTKNGSKIGKIYITDTTTLYSGESEEEAHKRITEAIKKVAPEVSVTTRWHYSSWEWDEEFTDDN